MEWEYRLMGQSWSEDRLKAVGQTEGVEMLDLMEDWSMSVDCLQRLKAKIDGSLSHLSLSVLRVENWYVTFELGLRDLRPFFRLFVIPQIRLFADWLLEHLLRLYQNRGRTLLWNLLRNFGGFWLFLLGLLRIYFFLIFDPVFFDEGIIYWLSLTSSPFDSARRVLTNGDTLFLGKFQATLVADLTFWHTYN